MASVHVVKNAHGKLEGFGERGARAYDRFLKAIREAEVGELFKFDYKVPRAPKFHKLHFVMLALIYDSQEQWTNELHFRKWSEVGAGHCDMVPDGKGGSFPVPRSIDYESLDDVEFGEVHAGVKGFFRTEHARRYLWPHLTDEQTYEMIETLLAEFER
jgi:hypothetical protein